MPFYDYRCSECGHEIIDYNKKISADHPTTCPECGKEGLQQIYSNHDQFVELKGAHWHEASGKRGKF